MNKEKRILIDYMDACELIKETEADIRKLRKQEVVYDKVKGSNPEFPYQGQSFNIGGVVENSLNVKHLRREKELLKQRIENASRIKIQAEEIMNYASVRMKRIIRYRFFERLTWEQVAINMREGKSGDAYRKEFSDYLKEK